MDDKTKKSKGLDLICLMLEEEKSDVECKLIAKGIERIYKDESIFSLSEQ